MTVINSIKNENIIFSGKKFHKNRLIQPTNTNLQAGFSENQLQLMDTIRKAADGKDVYLFGGAVRDCLLQKNINDLDFIINGDALDFSKELLEKHNDVFKRIFLKPSVKRAVIYTKDTEVDLKPLADNGETICGKDNIRKALIKNISDNDFSINSMLIKLDENEKGGLKLKFIDYFKGKKDLIQNKLKHNKKESFFDNPIQALRGIRLKVKYGMKVNPDTNELIENTIRNPQVKKNKFYFRYMRECYRISKEFIKRFLNI